MTHDDDASTGTGADDLTASVAPRAFHCRKSKEGGQIQHLSSGHCSQILGSEPCEPTKIRRTMAGKPKKRPVTSVSVERAKPLSPEKREGGRRAKPVARPTGRPGAPSVPSTEVTDIDGLLAKWLGSSGAERANKDSFFRDLCDAIDVPHPDPTTGDQDLDGYVFERDARLVHEGGTTTIGRIDLYKRDCFILEAKQGSGVGAAKLGTAKRETPSWNIAMKDAYGQALGYARAFDSPVPFIVVADIGYCFDLYAAFDKNWDYRPFPNAQSNRLFLGDLSMHARTLRQVFLDPHDLDPSRHAAKVTQEIAGYIANLAKNLEALGHAPDLVATFLMRCLFTMFAEDVGLLPERMFTDALEKIWIPNPSAFPGGIESLWRAMNDGGHLMVGKILKFNGGLFADPTALPLDRHALDLLALAAECNWAEVEPAIFGTLLERALDPKERHSLGAHFTPRAYVERIVRPTIEEPLRAEWDLVQAQVRQLVIAAGELEPGQIPTTIAEHVELGRAWARQKARSHSGKVGARTAKMNEAISLLRGFHRRLCETSVLDPACGSGNFLYVTLDLFKRLEGEVLAALAAIGETQELLAADAIRVTPAQFHGIEVKRWAKEIAELVLWIGYLQWHFRAYGRHMPVPEPVLRDYKNIECRDAVLAWDARTTLVDEHGVPVTRWDGETTKTSAVTGEQVPDAAARALVYRYENPRKAAWPHAEFVVGNPPFVGNKRMRLVLGDGYVEALRHVYDGVPETADFVMYWWDRGADRVRARESQRSGLITTNSITQALSRRLVERHLREQAGVSLAFAIPDHPWVDSEDGAAVRIAMTVLEGGTNAGMLQEVIGEHEGADDVLDVTLSTKRGRIQPNLRVGADATSVVPLKANASVAFQGVIPLGQGFRLKPEEVQSLGFNLSSLPETIRRYVVGRDIVQHPEERYVVDFFGLSEAEAARRFPSLYQRLLVTVKPERDQNRRETRKKNWWLFGENAPKLRRALSGIRRFIGTPDTSKFKVFTFFDSTILPDVQVYSVASEDAYVLGILSGSVHQAWLRCVAPTLEDRPRWKPAIVWDPFPLPSCSDDQKERIRTIAERLDEHRKRQQAQHPDLTLTNVYNVLDALRAGKALDEKDKITHEHGLVSILKQMHDALDVAVLDAYGWPSGLTDEQILEKLVALNGERASEERRGLVRWLRPELQDPATRKRMTQTSMSEVEGDVDAADAAPAVATRWPEKMSDQVAAVRDLLTRGPTEWSASDVVANLAGASNSNVVDVLDSLSALGLLITYELPEGRRWRSAAFVSRMASA